MQDFSGIAEKLKRAKQNIDNFYIEMVRFFEESDYPILPENDKELLLKAIEYHKNLVIPPRFSVLAGEIIHHLRSCFDHVVYHFSTGPKQNNMPIDFPVFEVRPVKKSDSERFKGKIQRITNPNVRSLIERLQPYNAADPLDDPLWIIHNIDIIDKHKELIFCGNVGSRALPREMEGVLECYTRAHPELDPAQIAHHFKSHGPLQPCVAFRNFGRRKFKPATEGLIELFKYTLREVDAFRVL